MRPSSPRISWRTLERFLFISFIVISACMGYLYGHQSAPKQVAVVQQGKITTAAQGKITTAAQGKKTTLGTRANRGATTTAATGFRPFSLIANDSDPRTDKITTHRYGLLYDVYFNAQATAKHVKLFEIGLGCKMMYGPGASAQIWPTLFPDSEIWFGEYDEECVKSKWNPSLPWRYVAGDQANYSTLYGWLKTTGGNFDYIIDDGGHKPIQQWHTFQILFEKALKMGGVYFIEDLQVNRDIRWDTEGGVDETKDTFLDIIYDWLEQLIVCPRGRCSSSDKPIKHKLPKDLAKIECIPELCAFTKGDRWPRPYPPPSLP